MRACFLLDSTLYAGVLATRLKVDFSNFISIGLDAHTHLV
jgi:hypothetical protein